MPEARAAVPVPPRFARASPLGFVLAVAAAALVLASLAGADVSPARLAEGIPRAADMAARMFPPDLDRLGPILLSLLETFQMAVAGTAIGVLLSLPLAVLASRRLGPGAAARAAARGLVALFRTVPDLVWALLFVIAVGLGPFAGTLALVVDTVGYCGRFFAEAMEDTDPGPEEALAALGASPAGVLACAVLPAALPALVAASLFALERSVRGSVVLGLVGAGGVGIELKVALDMFQYDEALTIIAAVFVLVLLVEAASGAARRRISG